MWRSEETPGRPKFPSTPTGGGPGEAGPWGRSGPLRRLVATAAAAALLGGCATPTLPEPGGSAAASWLGRFSASWSVDASPPRAESASGRFTLSADAARTQIEIFSPFGQTVARAVTDARASVLETADGRRFEAADPETLTETVLGWRVPVQHLPAWLAGNRPDRAIDGGWEVSIDARADGLPSRMTMKWPADGAGATARQVTIRLLIDATRAVSATAATPGAVPAAAAAPAAAPAPPPSPAR